MAGGNRGGGRGTRGGGRSPGGSASAGVFFWRKKNGGRNLPPGEAEEPDSPVKQEVGSSSDKKVEEAVKKLTVRERFVLVGDLIKQTEKSYKELLSHYDTEKQIEKELTPEIVDLNERRSERRKRRSEKEAGFGLEFI